MSTEKKEKLKSKLHPRNRNRERYNLDELIKLIPKLRDHLSPNRLGEDSIDFSNPTSVKLLNKALLNQNYGITNWDFPDENLCPPIPGRADYIHHIADLLRDNNFGKIPTGDKVKCLDIGTGASCIYPIIGACEYNWSFIGSDIDSKSITSVRTIIESNRALRSKVECRLQVKANNIFKGVIKDDEIIDITICNPPFHSSSDAAQRGAQRKVKNLSGKYAAKPVLNFSGVHNELIYDGGEYQFIANMIKESKSYAKNCFWFTTLVSKKSNLKGIYNLLERYNAYQTITIPMGTSNKSSRIVAWTFLSKEEQKNWKETRWSMKSN